MRRQRLSRFTLRLVVAAAAVAAGTAAAVACPYCRTGVASVVGTYDLPSVSREHGIDRPRPPTTRPAGRGGTAAPADRPSVPAAAARPPADPPLPFGLSVSGGTDVASAYYHRGYLMGDRGAILQPYLSLARPLLQTGRFSLTPYAGTWMGLQEGGTHTGSAGNGTATSGSGTATMFCCSASPASRPGGSSAWITPPDVPIPAGGPLGAAGIGAGTTAASGAAAVGRGVATGAASPFGLYEADLTGGLAINAGPLFCDLKYTDYTYPGGALQGYQEVGAKLSVDLARIVRDDADLLPVIVRPYIEVERETAGAGRTPFTYVAVGVEPAVAIPVGGRRIGLSVPVEVGLSATGFYQDADGSNAALGFDSVGLKVTVPLADSTRGGQWFVSGSVTVLHLDAANLRALNGGRAGETYGSLGVSFKF